MLCVALYSWKVSQRVFVTPIPQTIAHTSDKVTQSLEQHFLWSELTVLSRFLLALSCNNPRNGKVGVLRNVCNFSGGKGEGKGGEERRGGCGVNGGRVA